MGLVLQLLDFNKKNSSEEFMNSFVANDEDIKLYNKLIYNLENFLDEGEDFGIMELEFYDINNMTSVSLNEENWENCIMQCQVSNLYDCLVLKNDNRESFEFVMNTLYSINNIDYLDKELNYITKNLFQDFLSDNIKEGNPTVISLIFYSD